MMLGTMSILPYLVIELAGEDRATQSDGGVEKDCCGRSGECKTEAIHEL